ncbi:hypothetical protein [Sulfurihydrogenibium sp.]|nr:hypothetical protein [Sulfurihydrogenibium sp.]
MKKLILAGLCVGVMTTYLPSHAVESVKVIAATCFGCHGPDGKTTKPC